MDLLLTHDIDKNVFSTTITVLAFGTEQLSPDEEKELLSDFPTSIMYRKLTFSKNVKLAGSVPEVTTDEVGEGVVAVTLPTLSNKEIFIDEHFSATYKIDSNKVSPTAVDADVLTSKELVAQAYCIVFDKVICDAVQAEMNALREKAPAFAGEDTVTV